MDTENLSDDDQRILGNSAVVKGNRLVGYHVTDDPKKILASIQGKSKLIATYGKGRGKYSELGPGLYLSAIPHFWVGRSTGKWNFLDNLDDNQRQALANKLLNDKTLNGEKLPDGRIFNYVASFEKESAIRTINSWLESKYSPILVGLAGQPYNIKFWKPEYLKPLGIDPSPTAKVIEFEVKGKFANLGKHVNNWSVISNAIRSGLDGAFSSGGWSTNSEFVVWKKEAILGFEVKNGDEFLH